MCLENDALLIFDEVQTGVGMTGKMWAHQVIGVEPDIIAFGKKTQVCGILAGRRLDEVESHVFKLGSRINSTWGGNLVDMVRFDRILEIIEEDNLIENANVVGEHLIGLLHSLSTETNSVTNVRGVGLMCAMDLPTAEFRDRLLQRCYDEGMIILGCGARSVRFRSPLTITKEEISTGLNLIREAILRIEEEYRPYEKKRGLTDALLDG